MKKRFSLIVFMLIAQISFGQTTFNYKDDFEKILAKTNDSKDRLAYNTLLKRFTTNDTTLTDFEILALLIGFTDKPEYKPYKDLTAEAEIYQLNGEKKYKESLELGSAFIRTHPFNVRTIIGVSFSFHKLNQADSAMFYMHQATRIFEAMYFSGNGKTPETPTFALGPGDGQDYITKFIGQKIGSMGSGRDKNGNFLDILEMKFEDGQAMNLYFIIQHASEKMFLGENIPEELKPTKKKQTKSRQ